MRVFNTAAPLGAAEYINDPRLDSSFASRNALLSAVVADGRVFRLDISRGVSVLQVGLDPSGVEACDSRFNALFAYMREIVVPQTNGPRTWVMPPVDFEPGHYAFAQPINLKDKVVLRAVGVADSFGRIADLMFPSDCVAGIIVNRQNTYGVREIVDANSGSAANSVIRGLSIRCLGINPSVTDYDGCGVLFRAAGTIENCEVDGWSASGIAVIANIGGGAAGHEGEASETRIKKCVISNNRQHGVQFTGADVNIGQVTNCRLAQNGGYGLYNTDSGPLLSRLNHFVANGRKGDGGGQASTSLVSNNGRLFSLRWNVSPAVGSQSGNGPPSSGDNAFWVDINRPDPNHDAINVAPQWVPGIALRNGGIFYSAATGFKSLTDYAEGTQAAGWANLYGRSADIVIDAARYEATKIIGYQP